MHYCPVRPCRPVLGCAYGRPPTPDVALCGAGTSRHGQGYASGPRAPPAMACATSPAGAVITGCASRVHGAATPGGGDGLALLDQCRSRDLIRGNDDAT